MNVILIFFFVNLKCILIHIISMLDHFNITYLDLDSAFQAFIITVIWLCFIGYLLVDLRVAIVATNKRNEIAQSSATPIPGYINATFAGVLLETLFLVSI